MKKKVKLKNLLKEYTGTNVGTGLNTGDAWPDGIFTKYGETRLMGPGGMPRGMKQLVAPAADSVYGGDGTKRDKMSMEKDGVMKKTKITPEYVKSNQVIDPHELRDDTPPLAPKQRVFGRRQFGHKPDYIIPRETANFVTSAENTLIKPTTPPEGSVSGGIPATPEKGSKSAGSKSGYRQLQKGGENMVQGKGIDKMYVYKMLGQYDPKKEGLSEHMLRVLLEAGSLPLKLKNVKKHSKSKIKRKSDGGVNDDFFTHHSQHSGPHLKGKGAEHATYDFDDDDYDVEGGLQDREDGQDRGYEPVETITKELKDHEGKMAKGQLERSMKYSKMIYNIIQNVDKGNGVEFPAWVQSKLTKSMDYLQSVYNYLDGKDGLEDKFQDEASTTLNVPAYQTPLAYKKSTRDALDWDDEDDSDELLGGLKDTRKKNKKKFKEDLDTPPKYSNPEAKLHIDADIKKMSKILGKASQEVIKIMMDGVKGGRYDALDIQRGIKFGPFNRTHEGERPFMSMLWHKVRKGFRRYMPKGKLRK